ncbi:MAG: AAA family ATPase [Agitococcus sp.]|nr:AAA family ATPase [Agitococcus sp.]
MNNILNLAAYLEKIESFEFAITVEGMVKAIHYCNIPDPEINKKVRQCFGIIPDDNPITIYGEDEWKSICESAGRAKASSRYMDWERSEITFDLAKKLENLKIKGIDYQVDKISTWGDSGYKNLKTIKALKSYLMTKVLDQNEAIEAVGDALVKSFYKPNPAHPKGVLLFLGPPATGKTLLAECISEHLCIKEDYFTQENNYLRIDMSRFSHEQEKSALFGLERFWNGTAPGLLTAFVREHPDAVVVFDEFEKAHSKIQDRFLSILNDGYCDDACGWYKDGKPYSRERTADAEYADEEVIERVDFTQTILIFTSNLGKEVYSDATFTKLLKNSPGESEKIMFDTLMRETKIEGGHRVNAISPEFLSRLRQGRLILFNTLTFDTLRKIATNNMLSEAEKFSNAYVCKIEYENLESVVDALLLTSAPSFDIRGINSHSANLIYDKITDHIMKYEFSIKTISIGVSKQLKEELLSLFTEDLEQFKRDIFRKNMTFDLDISLTSKGSHIHVTIDTLHKKQIKRATDYQDGGISAQLPEITFANIAGHSKTKENLIEISNVLKSYKKLKSMGIEVPKGMLMYGPPGTGKTMLAKAFASQSGLPFISTTGKNMLNDDYMKKVFDTAKLYAPSIVFIDEMDAIRKRGSSAHNDSYYDKITNQLLTHIDGFETSQSDPVFIIAATNNPDMIDPAILRSGRIDMHVEVGILDRDARAYLIDLMLQKEIFSDTIDRERILFLTAGMSGADLKVLDRECSMESIRRQEDKVSEEMIIERINVTLYGEKSPIKRRDEHLAETAYHEAGHAIVSKYLMPERMIQQVTITPRGVANGFVAYAPDELKQIKNTKLVIQNLMAMALGGRIAQIIKFGEDNIDSGASSDLEHANALAFDAITKLGMDSRLQNVCVSIKDVKHDGLFGHDIEIAMKEWLADAGIRSREVLEKNWGDVEKLAQMLLKQDTVYSDELDSILKQPVKKSRTSDLVNKKKESL